MTYPNFLPLQEAIFASLMADSTLMALVDDIYDHVPQNPVFPYVAIGNTALRDWSSKTTKGCEHSIKMNIFSRQAGRKESSDIMSRIVNLLHDANLTVTGAELVLLRYVSSVVELMDDGLTYRGTLELRALVQEV